MVSYRVAYFQTKKSYDIAKCTVILRRHTQAHIANYNHS